MTFLWAASASIGRTGARLLVRSYGGGNALLRDDTIHKGAKAGLGFVRLGHELAHNLLRIDRAAGALIGKLADDASEPMERVSATLPIGDALRRLAALRATRHADETAMHHGIVFSNSKLLLVRVAADSLGPEVNMTANITIESGTHHYSVA
jgi:hypothetical protein